MPIEKKSDYDSFLRDEYPEIEQMRKKAVKKAVWNILLYEISVTALFALSFGYIKEIYSANRYIQDNTVIMIRAALVFVLLAVLPPLLFKGTKVLTDKTVFGTVLSVKYEQHLMIDRGHTRTQEWIRVTCRDGEGKTKKLGFSARYGTVLAENVEFVRLRGIPYPIPKYREVTKKHRFVCAGCGKTVGFDAEKCDYCEKPIIHLEDMEKPRNRW